MSTNAIISTRNLDINRISFVQGNAKANRIPSINIKYDGQNIGIRLPRLSFPFGVSKMDKDGPASYTLTAPLKSADPYGKERADDANEVGRFYNFLIDLQEKIVQAAVENSVKWFGKKRSEELIRESMKPLIRIHTAEGSHGERVPSGKYPPNVTLKIPVYSNPGEAPRVYVDIVDSRGNPMYVTPASLESVFSKGVEANLAVTASIYVMTGGGFGVTWRVSHAQVFQQARMTAASVFSDTIEDGDDQEEVVTESHAPEVAGPPVEIEIPETLDEAPPPPPAPAGRKRRAVPSTSA